MKYTIHGFSQREAIRLKLDNDDLLLLRWMVDFSNTGKMEHYIIQNNIYYWVNYQTVCNDLPILATKKDTLYRRMKKLCDSKILKHKTLKVNGTYSLYGFSIAFERLISDDYEEGYGKKSEGGTEKIPEGVRKKIPNKDLSIINPSTIKSHTGNGNKSKKNNVCVELASQIETVVGQSTAPEVVKSLLKKADEETVKHYISMWDKYKGYEADSNNPLSWFIHCVSTKRPVPQPKTNNSYNNGKETFRDFDQREYEEKDFEKYYANLNDN